MKNSKNYKIIMDILRNEYFLLKEWEIASLLSFLSMKLEHDIRKKNKELQIIKTTQDIFNEEWFNKNKEKKWMNIK